MNFEELHMLRVAKAIVEFVGNPIIENRVNMLSAFEDFTDIVEKFPAMKFAGEDKLANLHCDYKNPNSLDKRLYQTLQMLGGRHNIKAIKIYIDSVINLTGLYIGYYVELREIICREIDMFYMKKCLELNNDEDE